MDVSTQSRGGISLSEQIEIRKYKIKGNNGEDLDHRYHHVPASLESSFRKELHILGKQWEFSPSEPYFFDEEEYETTPDDDKNVHHPLNGINRKELGDILNPIEIYGYTVKKDSVKDRWQFYVPSDGHKAFEKYLERQGYTRIAKLGSRSYSSIRYQKLCRFPTTRKRFIPVGEYDNLSHEFEEELIKRNINKEDLTMSTTITTDNNKSITLEFTLEQQLKALNDEQYLTLFSLYGQDGIEQYNELIEDCEDLDEVKDEIAEALAERIDQDDNEEQKSELLELIKKYHLDYYSKDAHLDSLKTQVKDSRDELKTVVKGFNKKINQLVSGDNLLLLKQEKEERKLNKAKLKRQKRIERGIDAYLMGVACSVIDEGKEGGEQYIKKATDEANQVLAKAVAVVNEMNNNDKLPDPQTEAGMKKVFKVSLPNKKKKGFAVER